MDGPGSDSAALAACTSLGIGLSILYITIFTLTISHWSLPYFRLAVAPVAIRSFWNFGFGLYEGPTRVFPSAFATVGLYGIMRILDHSVISFWDDTPPHWVVRPRSSGGTRVVPLPDTFGARCAYALDLLTSMRGLSWYHDLEWNWRSRCLPPHPPKSRTDFVLSGMRAFVIQYTTLDACDIILRLRSWDSNSLRAMTELSAAEQVVYSITVCVGTCFTMATAYSLISSACVVCGSSPSAWPPFFDSPFSSKSLKEFWSRRWHFMFRHIFERLSLPFMRLLLFLSGGRISSNGRLANVLRMLMAFVFSTLLHLTIMYRMFLLENIYTGRTDSPLFFNKLVLGFFLFQPLGLVAESVIIIPVADWMFPGPKDRMQESREYGTNGTPLNGRATATESVRSARRPSVRWEREIVLQLYVWVFLIWTGRWWCDAWVRGGLLDKEVKPIPLSPLRGLWQGHWIV